MKKYQVNMSEKAFNNLGQLVSASALPLESGGVVYDMYSSLG